MPDTVQQSHWKGISNVKPCLAAEYRMVFFQIQFCIVADFSFFLKKRSHFDLDKKKSNRGLRERGGERESLFLHSFCI
jgi:hypothetical protein